MSKEKRKVNINGNRYHIVAEESSKYRRVSVYDNSRLSHRASKTDLVYDKRRKCWPFGILKRDVASTDEMIKEALNEAVCILEDKQSEQDQFETKIDSAIDTVKETHENE